MNETPSKSGSPESSFRSETRSGTAIEERLGDADAHELARGLLDRGRVDPGSSEQLGRLARVRQVADGELDARAVVGAASAPRTASPSPPSGQISTVTIGEVIERSVAASTGLTE